MDVVLIAAAADDDDDVNKLRVLIASRDMREVSDWAIVSEETVLLVEVLVWLKSRCCRHKVRHGGYLCRSDV